MLRTKVDHPDEIMNECGVDWGKSQDDVKAFHFEPKIRSK